MAVPSTARKASSNAVPVLVPQGSHAGKPSLPLGRPFTLIGSRHRAHLHLLSRTVSKSHAAIIATDAGLYIRDLASRERVYINNKQVREADLRDGDILRIGSFNFKYTDPLVKQRSKTATRATEGSLQVDGTTIPLSAEDRTIVIGRRPTCDIPLMELSASTIHAIIFEINGQRYIRDLGSRTGTFVNGSPVQQRPIQPGDTIKIGETEMSYVVAEAEVEAIESISDLEPLPLELETEGSTSSVAPASQQAPALVPATKDDDLIPLAGEEDVIPLAPVEPAAPVAAAPIAIDQEADEKDRHLLVSADLHQEKLSGSGSFADVSADAEEAEEEHHPPIDLDWWPEQGAANASAAPVQRPPIERVAEPEAQAAEERIPLVTDEDLHPHVDAAAPENAGETTAPENESRTLTAHAGAVTDADEPVLLPETPDESATPEPLNIERAAELAPIPDVEEVEEQLIATAHGELSSEPPADDRLDEVQTPSTLPAHVSDSAEESAADAIAEAPPIESHVSQPWPTPEAVEESSHAELLPDTEPTPESAQPLEPALSSLSDENASVADPALVGAEAVADLSDTSFGRTVQELAQSEQPLVEEPSAVATATALESEPTEASPTPSDDQLPHIIATAHADVIEPEVQTHVGGDEATDIASAEDALDVAEADAQTAPAAMDDDAAAELLAEPAASDEVPDFSGLLEEDGLTGDPLVDNAAAFLAHEAETSEQHRSPSAVTGELTTGEEEHDSAVDAAAGGEPEKPQADNTVTAPVGVFAEPIFTEAPALPVDENIATVSEPLAAEEPVVEAQREPSVATEPHFIAPPPVIAPAESIATETEFVAPAESVAELEVEPEARAPQSRVDVQASSDEIAIEVASPLAPVIPADDSAGTAATEDERAPLEPLETEAKTNPEVEAEIEPEIDQPLDEQEWTAEEAPPVVDEPPAATLADENRSSVPPGSAPRDEGLPRGALDDLMASMSRDSGSFLGGMPLPLAPAAFAGVAPAVVKVNQDAAAAPPTPAPIANVQAQIPPAQVIGVPPDESEESSELFGEDSAKLDTLPDELEPIEDVTDAVKPAPRPAGGMAGRGVGGAKPQASRMVPPPPARTRRAVSPFDGLDDLADGLDDIITSMPAGMESDRDDNKTTAFDGLALEHDSASVDAFSLLPAPANDPMMGGQPADAPQVSREAQSEEPLPAERSGAARVTRGPIAKRAGQGEGIVPPPQTRPEQPPPKKKRRWKFFGSILLALMVGASAATWAAWPYRWYTTAALRFDGLPSLPPGAQQAFLEARAGEALSASVLKRAAELTRDSPHPTDPGFLAQAAAVEPLVRSARLQGDSVILQHNGRDSAAERLRLQSLLTALYEANQFRAAENAAREKREAQITLALAAAETDTQAVQARQALWDKRQRAERLLVIASDRLAAREAALEQATHKLNELQAAMKQSQASASPAPVIPEADPQLKELSAKIRELDAQVAAARTIAGDPASVHAAFDAALQSFSKQIQAVAPAPGSVSALTGAITAASSAREHIQQAAESFDDLQRTNVESLAELRRQQAHAQQARLQPLLSDDAQLKDLRQKWALKDRQANTAADTNFTADAARFRAEADVLRGQIDQRTAQITAAAGAAPDPKLMEVVYSQMRKRQQDLTRKLADEWRAVMDSIPAADELTATDRPAAEALVSKLLAVKAAGEQLALSYGPAPFDPEARAAQLQQQRQALATKYDEVRKQVVEEAAAAELTAQAQLAASNTRRAAAVDAQEAAGKASDARDAAKAEYQVAQSNLSQLSNAPIDIAADNARLAQVEEESHRLQAELNRLRAQPAIVAVAPTSSAVQTEPLDSTPRIAATAAIAAIGILLFALCWRAGSIRSEIPKASIHVNEMPALA